MSPCAYSRRYSDDKEGRTHRFSTAALLAVVVLSSALSSRAWADETGAATRTPLQGRPPGPDALLSGLSFSSSNKPVSVSADSLEFDYRTHILKYEGGVVATQGDMRLQSHTLTVVLDSTAKGSIKEVIAQGEVHLSKGSRWATGGRAVFNRRNNTVVLSDNAVLHDGPNEVSGNRVVVYLDQDRSVVEGGTGRVKAVLYPPKAVATPTVVGGQG